VSRDNEDALSDSDSEDLDKKFQEAFDAQSYCSYSTSPDSPRKEESEEREQPRISIPKCLKGFITQSMLERILKAENGKYHNRVQLKPMINVTYKKIMRQEEIIEGFNYQRRMMSPDKKSKIEDDLVYHEDL